MTAEIIQPFDGLDPDQARAYGLGHAGKPLDFNFSLSVEPQDEPLGAFKASLTRDLMMFAAQAERALSAWHKGTQDGREMRKHGARNLQGVCTDALKSVYDEPKPMPPTVEDAQFKCAGCGEPYALEGVQSCPSCEPKA